MSYDTVESRSSSCAFMLWEGFPLISSVYVFSYKVVTGFEVTRRILVDLEGISLRRKWLAGLEPENVHMIIGEMPLLNIDFNACHFFFLTLFPLCAEHWLTHCHCRLHDNWLFGNTDWTLRLQTQALPCWIPVSGVFNLDIVIIFSDWQK